jgi:hypothetical protein
MPVGGGFQLWDGCWSCSCVTGRVTF